MVLVVKNLSAVAGDSLEVRVQSWGWEDPLQEEVALLPSIPAWKTPQAVGLAAAAHGAAET